MAVDPLADYANQEGLNPFQFCGNDPANFTDPDGLVIKRLSLSQLLISFFSSASKIDFGYHIGIEIPSIHGSSSDFANNFGGSIPTAGAGGGFASSGGNDGAWLWSSGGGKPKQTPEEIARNNKIRARENELDGQQKKQNKNVNPTHEWQTYNQLTQSEKKLSKRHPLSATIVYNNRAQAFEMTRRYFPSAIMHNDAADAFRHAFFNAINARLIGPELAYSFARAHEDFSGNPTLERAMDMNNNVFGINLGIHSKTLNNEEIAKKIYDAVINGKLIMISGRRLVPTNQ